MLTIEIAGKGKSFIVFYNAHIEFYSGAPQKIQIGLAHKCDQRLFILKKTQVTATSNEENMKVCICLSPLFIFPLIFHIFDAGTCVFNDR